MTSVVEDALEKGLTYRIKMIRKELDPNFLNGEKKQDQAQEQENNNKKTRTQEYLDKEGITEEQAIKISKTSWVDDDN